MECHDVNFFKENRKNKNTTKATNNWMRNFKKWAENKGLEQDIEKLDGKTLNNMLEVYFAEVKKKDGRDYEPTSLCALEAAIDRYLKEKGSLLSIFKDREFQGSRDVLEGKGKYLREELGLGKHPNRADSLSRLDEEQIWRSEQLGGKNGRSLINSMWFLLSQHFGLRGREQHYNMQIEDFVFRADEHGNEYITFSEGASKTRQAGLHQKERLVKPKMFATGESRCPISLFRSFVARRPENLRTKGPFYLGVIENPIGEVWFKKSRLGINYINNIMKTMANGTPALKNSNKHLTNHTVRSTVIKKLKKSRVPKSEIVGITGHSRESGLDPYDSGDEAQQREYSLAIDNVNVPGPSGINVPGPSTVCVPAHSGVKAFSSETLPQKSFNFFSDNQYESFNMMQKPIMNFYNCQVKIGEGGSSQSIVKRKRKVRIIESDSSSQE